MRLLASLCSLAVAALLSVSGCRPFTPATPPAFVELDDKSDLYRYRATTAEGVVLAVRVIDNDVEGDRAFWEKAIENRMHAAGGYALLDRHEVACAGDHKGTQFRFGHDEGREPFLYLMTVFVLKKRVFVLEAGGKRAEIERFEPPIQWAIRNFHPKGASLD
jgi:hypothetical protein